MAAFDTSKDQSGQLIGAGEGRLTGDKKEVIQSRPRATDHLTQTTHSLSHALPEQRFPKFFIFPFSAADCRAG